MRSKSHYFRLPTALEDIAEARSREVGYESLSEYVLGLLRYDLLVRRAHATTANLARLSRAEQDKIDDEIAAMFAKGEALAGSLFEKLVEDAVKAAGFEAAPSNRKVGEELLRRITAKRRE